MPKRHSTSRKAKPAVRRTNRSTPAHRTSRPRPHVGVLAFLLAGLLLVFGGMLLQPAIMGSADSCTVTDKLVNPCRPWLGAAANNYPQAASDSKSQLLYHEQRIGRQLDLIHTYHPVGSNQLSTTDKYFAQRDGTYLFANWKPAAVWADAGGGNATTNAGIDQMANSIKSIAPKKIFLTIHHEPENDVTSGAPGCSTFKGSAGTPTDYKNMWQNVRNRFDALGVNNVVWAMDYMNYSLWDCMVNDMYPGDNLVDWVVFNAYAGTSLDFYTNASHFYNILVNNSNSSHNYTSKPWGIVEWGIGKSATSAQRSAYFDQAKAVMDNNSLPNLKLYMVYDSRDQGSNTGDSSRVAYDGNDVYQPDQAAHYSAFANDPKITGNGGVTPPPADPTPPPSGGGSSGGGSSSGGSSTGGGTTSGGTSGGSSTPDSGKTTAATQPVKTETRNDGSIVIKPSSPDANLEVLVDGKQVEGTTIDPHNLTNGVHKITVVEDGVTKTKTISVHNPLPLAIVNHVRANGVRYGVGFLATGFGLGLWVGQVYIPGVRSGLMRLAGLLHIPTHGMKA
jgi:uncharacterized membrane protein YgcG